MATSHDSDNSRSNPHPTNGSPTFGRTLLGAAVAGGIVVASLLIERLLTSDPNVGVRAGVLVGGLCGGVISVGAGWRGIGVVLSMLLCSAGVAALGLALGDRDPNQVSIPAVIGGILGAFIGLGFGVVLFRKRRPAAPPKEAVSVGK